MTKDQLADLIHGARVIVRETGWVAMVHDTSEPSQTRLAIMHAYDMACSHLIQLDPIDGPGFIRVTYGPAYRCTEVTK